jgi:transcriptional regulator with XRE-family HTH domain
MKEINFLQKFGKRMRDLRKINRMSQERLAEKADLSTNFVGSLERAEKEPKFTTLVKIAKAFNVSVAELLSFPDDKKVKSAKPELLDRATEVLRLTLDLLQGYRKEK